MSRVEQEEIVQEIIYYLASHPRAADTLDHVTRWWLPAKSAAVRDVRGALRHLVKLGVLDQLNLPGGGRLYKACLVQLQPYTEIAGRGQVRKEGDLDEA